MPKDRTYSSLEEALSGIFIPDEIRASLVLIDVLYRSFGGTDEIGQLVVHEELVLEMQELFSFMHGQGFPIQKVVPIAAYGWDDEASMRDNNTSAFNYRRIIGTNDLSNHSFGRAIDINPRLNPYYAKDGNSYPAGATYDPTLPGTLVQDSEIVRAFKERGWRWLGEREENADYQHFDKL